MAPVKPSMTQMITMAIKRLKERHGSSCNSIQHYIQVRLECDDLQRCMPSYQFDPSSMRTALTRGTASGRFVKVNNLYKLGPTDKVTGQKKVKDAQAKAAKAANKAKDAEATAKKARMAARAAKKATDILATASRAKPTSKKNGKAKMKGPPVKIRPMVPEPLEIQEFWATKISPDGGEVEFKGGAIVLRLGVPRTWGRAEVGICCTYFVSDNKHFLAMVSEKELAKMNYTFGKEKYPMTSHAKTLTFGMQKAQTRKGVRRFTKVDACFGFWYDVSKEGLAYKFRSCANYYNTSSGYSGPQTRSLAGYEEGRLLAALRTVKALPKEG